MTGRRSLKPPAEPPFAGKRPRAAQCLSLWAAFVLAIWPLQPVQPALAGPRGIPALKSKIARHLNNSCLRRGRIGIRALSLGSRRLLYDLRGEELFIPASNLKLLTTAAAFYYLKPDFHFKTEVSYKGRLSSGRLAGNLYLKGFGDPSLVTEELWVLVRTLKRRGVRRVRGDLVVDDSYFDREQLVPGTGSGQGLRAYQAPHGAASLNFNTFKLYVEPSPVVGRPPRAVVDPDSPYVQLINKAKTVGRRSKSTLQVQRGSHADGDRIVLEGRLRAGSRPRPRRISITAPALYLGHTFREFLRSQGITVSGRVRRGRTPPDAPNLVRHLSKPLSVVLWGLNKWSNNFIAEQVLKTLGAELLGAPGTRQKGIAVVQRYMKRLGYRPDTFVVADGSGLSRRSRVSPAQFVTVLSDMYSDFRFRPEFVASLPVMGVDGSVKDRLDGTPAERRIRAKTGTLKRVDSLSGYAFSLDGDIIAFSVLMNGSRCPHWKMRQIQDRITLELVRLDRRSVAQRKTGEKVR
ncbi:MAG: D-alanyl-D-alanine carboxypeptidase/D-alanyl-D-alanine-endopeptidase [Nitrospinota bacterium]